MQKHFYWFKRVPKCTLLFQSHTLLSSFPDRLLNTAGLPVMIHNCCVLSGEFCTSPEELTTMSYNFQCFFLKTIQRGRPPLWYFIKIKKIETELYRARGWNNPQGVRNFRCYTWQLLYSVDPIQKVIPTARI